MKVILHIGTEKTGTTLLQEWLYENEARLSAEGVALTRSGGRPNNQKFALSFRDKISRHIRRVAGPGPAAQEAERAEFQSGFRAELDRLSRRHHTLILTSEHFHSELKDPEHIARLKAFLDPVAERYTVICYFREQSEVRKSRYSTSVRLGHTQPLSKYKTKIGPGDHYFDYLLFFSKWEAVFGKAALRPRLYGRSQFKDGDLRKDFLSTCGLDHLQDALSFSTRIANYALSEVGLRLVRALNGGRPRWIGDREDPTGRALRLALLEADIVSKGAKILDTWQDEIFDRFAQSNRAFFERFFGVSQNLFARPSAAPEDAEAQTFGQDDLAQIAGALARTPNLLVLRDTEQMRLEKMIDRLTDEGAARSEEIALLQRILARSRNVRKP